MGSPRATPVPRRRTDPCRGSASCKRESVTRYASATQSSPLARCAAGIAGGLLASVAMNVFARALTAARGREADGAAPGADRHGRGVQPPQAEGAAEDDAAVRAGATAYRAVTGR